MLNGERFSLLVLGDFSPIAGLSGLSRSEHGHVSVFFSQPNCNTCDFHRVVLVLPQMTSFSGYFEERRMCLGMKLFFGLSVIKAQSSCASWAVVISGPSPHRAPGGV